MPTDLHQQRGAEHDQQRRRGHHLARAGPGEQAEERIEQIAAGEHQRRDRAADQRRGAGGLGEAQLRCALAAGARAAAPAPAAARPPCPGTAGSRRRAGRRPAAGGRAPPGCAARSTVAESASARPATSAPRQSNSPVSSASAADRRRGEHQLRDAEAEDVAPHREQARQLELEPDQEQQHHDAELGDREDALGRVEQLQPVGADDHARQQVGDDRREPREARDRHADHGGGEQHEGEAEQAEFGRVMFIACGVIRYVSVGRIGRSQRASDAAAAVAATRMLRNSAGRSRIAPNRGRFILRAARPEADAAAMAAWPML